MNKKENLVEKLNIYIQEHKDLDEVIYNLHNNKTINLMQIKRLKKRKLFLKDKIKIIKEQLEPDIIA